MNVNFSYGKFEKGLTMVALVFIALIYAAFPTKDFYWDGIFFAQIIEDVAGFGASLLHPNHLFYNAIGYLAFHAAIDLGFETRAIFALQIISSIFSVLCAAVLFFILRFSRRFSIYTSLSLTLLFAFSAVWWKFSIDAAAYVPSVFFLLVVFYLIQPNNPPRPILVAVVHSFGMFLHELAVLFFPVVILGLVFQTVAETRRERVSAISRYALTAFTLTFGTYYASYYLSSGNANFAGFVRWILWFAPDDGFNPSFWQSLKVTLEGHRKLFFEGRSGFFEANFITIVLTIMLGALIVFLIYQIGRNFNELKILGRTVINQRFYRQPTVALCAVWCASYILFLFFFIPRNTFYRLFYFPAVILLIGELLAMSSKQVYSLSIRRWRLAAFAAIVFLSNFIFFIRPHSQVRAGTPLALAAEANRIWTNRTVVYFADAEHLSVPSRYVRYFTPKTIWKPLDAMSLPEFDRQMKSALNNDGDIWLDASALERLQSIPDGKIWLDDNTAPTDQSNRLSIPNHKLMFTRIAL